MVNSLTYKNQPVRNMLQSPFLKLIKLESMDVFHDLQRFPNCWPHVMGYSRRLPNCWPHMIGDIPVLMRTLYFLFLHTSAWRNLKWRHVCFDGDFFSLGRRLDVKMPTIENGKGDGEEDMEQETPESDKSSEDESELGSIDEDESGGL